MQLFAFDDPQYGKFIKIADNEEDEDDEDNNGSTSETNNDDSNAPKLVPAPLQTIHSSTVKTASVTSVTKNMPIEWTSHDHPYDTGFNERR
ncbi:hypothetical protein O3M35_002520 [Rhynocoris fuscipes]|uniref:Uncharacterized protein n=1 Tax=Rhynocoris fuscipes TaxID=488301 RepID=A0AAW1CKL4_9HEMI